MQMLRSVNPMLNRYLRRSAFDIHDETSRNLFQIEGYMRYRSGQVSYEEMTQRGTFLTNVPLLASIPSGMVVALDDEQKETYHDDEPIGVRDWMNRYSYIGYQQQMYEGGRNAKVIRVDNRHAIKRDAIYMWTLAPSHKVRDICDDYHGRIYRGSDAPEPLHIGCNCQLRELDVSELQNPTYALNTMGENYVWGNVQKFVDEVNKLNSSIDNIQDAVNGFEGLIAGAATAASFIKNPIGTAATSLVDVIREQAVEHARKHIQTRVLSQMKTNTGELRSRLAQQSPELRRATQFVNAADRFVDGLNGVNSVSGAIDLLRNTSDELDVLGLNDDRLRRVANSPILQNTKAKAVMLEGGIKGLTRLAMILF